MEVKNGKHPVRMVYLNFVYQSLRLSVIYWYIQWYDIIYSHFKI